MVTFVEGARGAHHARAFGGEQFGDLLANAPAGAGHDRDTAVKLAHDFLLHSTMKSASRTAPPPASTSGLGQEPYHALGDQIRCLLGHEVRGLERLEAGSLD